MISSLAPAHSRVGLFTETPLDGGKPRQADLVCCAHCGFVWVWRKGSGCRRGWCGRCNGLVCGRAACRVRACCSWRQGLDNLEAGRAVDYRPVLVVHPG